MKLNLLHYKEHLSVFIDLVPTTTDYETAAHYFNLCRQHGIQGSNTDFLICALAVNHRLTIFTTDNDFTHYKQYLPINLHTI
ncbi:MAG TPA: PIN domain-containing protein [Anaerolineae bacterium]|nr:PIN domain-containing protein [Anaerolineae bacterium]